MWEFCTKYLKLSEGSAQRRISAMRFVQRLTDNEKVTTKEAIASGDLSLSNVTALQSFILAQKKRGIPPSNPSELISKAMASSHRKLQAKLYEISPEALPTERVKIVSAKKDHELKFVVSDELYQKLQKIRGLIAHKIPNATLAELTELLATEALTRLTKKAGIENSQTETASNSTHSGVATSASTLPTNKTLVVEKISCTTTSTAPLAVTMTTSYSDVLSRLSALRKQLPRKRAYLSVHLRRKLFSLAGGRCEYRFNEHRCTSTYALEIDHEVPLALNGTNNISNLRVLCRSHNLQQAEKKIGTRAH